MHHLSSCDIADFYKIFKNVMGITLNAAYLMMVEGIERPFRGTLLQLGRQTILFPYSGLKNLADFLKFPLAPLRDEDAKSDKWMTDKTFFQALGFYEVLSMGSELEGDVEYIWDFNNPVPLYYHEKFDVIHDGGAGEHIFNYPNFLSSVCSMLKVGGRAIHETATSGLLDHGFYAVQPTLYYDFFISQNFKINLLCLSKQDPFLLYSHTAEQIIYTPGMYDFEKTWVIDDKKTYSTFCVAAKQQKFEKMIIPQQSIWARAARQGREARCGLSWLNLGKRNSA